MEPTPTLWFGWFRADIIAEYAELFWRALRMTIAFTATGIVLGTARELKQNDGALLSGVVALTPNAGAYSSEIFTAGIQSIDRGQSEAARLGLVRACCGAAATAAKRRRAARSSAMALTGLARAMSPTACCAVDVHPR